MVPAFVVVAPGLEATRRLILSQVVLSVAATVLVLNAILVVRAVG